MNTYVLYAYTYFCCPITIFCFCFCFFFLQLHHMSKLALLQNLKNMFVWNLERLPQKPPFLSPSSIHCLFDQKQNCKNSTVSIHFVTVKASKYILLKPRPQYFIFVLCCVAWQHLTTISTLHCCQLPPSFIKPPKFPPFPFNHPTFTWILPPPQPTFLFLSLCNQLDIIWYKSLLLCFFFPLTCTSRNGQFLHLFGTQSCCEEETEARQKINELGFSG